MREGGALLGNFRQRLTQQLQQHWPRFRIVRITNALVGGKVKNETTNEESCYSFRNFVVGRGDHSLRLWTWQLTSMFTLEKHAQNSKQELLFSASKRIESF